MAYSIIDQVSIDLNWYFIDHYKHPCHVASAGGLLPEYVAQNDENNNLVNSIILDIQGDFQTIRNSNADSILIARGVQDLEAYYTDFESMARRGFFSFDKYDLEDPGDKRYFLVAYPIYIPYHSIYPIESKLITKLPRTRGTINANFINPFNLINYFNKLH